MFTCPACREPCIPARQKLAAKGACPRCGATIVHSPLGYLAATALGWGLIVVLVSMWPVHALWEVAAVFGLGMAGNMAAYLYFTPLHVAGTRAHRVDMLAALVLLVLVVAVVLFFQMQRP